jgi:N-methylhydantoinase B
MTTTASARDSWSRRITSLKEGYIPPAQLSIDPRLEFYADYDQDVDPITYEVLKSRFWNLNWDHQETVRRVSGSGVVVYGYDFNTSLQTELGDGVVFGPGNLMFAGCADLVIKWTLEHRSWSVGIHPGDVFIQDDPWVGTNHQMDTAVYAPVFVDGKLFAWVYNVVHQRELGGIEPGGFVQSAQDVFAEATFIPPTKLVDAGTLREDVAEAWIRRSRLPELIFLELKSQLAGVDFAHRRLDELIERYGAATVKGAMRKMIRDTAAVTRARLESIPDGTWRDVRYVGGSAPGVRRTHRAELRVRKEGGHLTISNEGTEPSTGSFNITAGQFRACVLNGLIPLIAYDQLLCGAGVLECVTIEPAPDVITSAHHPAAISTSMGTILTIGQSHQLFAKLLGASPELRRHVFCASGLHTCVLNAMFGVDQYGNPYANFPFDGTVGALGAFSWRDGLDHGGAISSTINPVGSVESWERDIPFLYLYRREVPHSGGHGRWRGGATFVAGWTGHRTPSSFVSSGGLYQSITLGVGTAGGMPATGGTMWMAHGTAVQDEFAAGRLPGSPGELRELAPDGAPPPPKVFDNRLDVGDVFEVMPSPGAGYGDPLLRDPLHTAADVQRERVTPEQARTIYGVVLEGGKVDADATASLREQLRRERLGRADSPARSAPELEGELVEVGGLIDTVRVVRDRSGSRWLACSNCGDAISPGDGSYRDFAAVLESPLPDLDPRIFQDPATQVDERIVVRQYLCPSCGGVLDAVVCPAESEREWDALLAPETKPDERTAS